MKILFLGDIMGRAGREAVLQHLPALRTRFAPDFVVANGENAAAGYGLTLKIANEFFEAGVDCITNGNHVWDQKELLTTIHNDARLLRPCNFPEGTPGLGFHVYKNKDGLRLLVINAMARLFMDALDDPFAVVDGILKNHALGKSCDAIFVDIHGEASSEKQALGVHLDGRISGIIGTHTHVPTADARVLPGGTAYQTDAGMCGDYDSVIGMKKEQSVQRFLRKYTFERLGPADGEGTVCGACIETGANGLATKITPFRIGGILPPA